MWFDFVGSSKIAPRRLRVRLAAAAMNAVAKTKKCHEGSGHAYARGPCQFHDYRDNVPRFHSLTLIRAERQEGRDCYSQRKRCSLCRRHNYHGGVETSTIPHKRYRSNRRERRR